MKDRISNSQQKPVKSFSTWGELLANGERWEAEIARNPDWMQFTDNMSKNPFEEMMAQPGHGTGYEPGAETFSPKGFEAMMPKMPKDMMEMVFGNTFNTEGRRQNRLLLTLAGLTMQGRKNDVPGTNGAPPERACARDQEY